MPAETAPNCHRCRHFFVTWEPATPRGCRAYGFKTVSMPSAVVERESGLRCQQFEEKPPAGASKERP